MILGIGCPQIAVVLCGLWLSLTRHDVSYHYIKEKDYNDMPPINGSAMGKSLNFTKL